MGNPWGMPLGRNPHRDQKLSIKNGEPAKHTTTAKYTATKVNLSIAISIALFTLQPLTFCTVEKIQFMLSTVQQLGTLQEKLTYQLPSALHCSHYNLSTLQQKFTSQLPTALYFTLQP
jgi:hypothetical protein